jgi:Tfp pilus tip-associated adhesin PilY1
MVDSDEDGLLDRVYAVDTLGRLFKHDLTSGQTCRIASLGESVFSSPAVRAGGSGQPVSIFVGGGPNPDGSGTVLASYHLFGLRDEDPPGTCTEGGAVQIYQVDAGAGQKVWATPVLSATDVFFATAGTASLGVCGSGAGKLITLSQTGTGTTPTSSNLSSAPALYGSPAQTLKMFDQHVLINTVGGETTVQAAGASGWNNALPVVGGAASNPTLDTLIWIER